MKILVVHNSYLYPGGEDEVVKAEVTMLRQFGHEVIAYQRSNKELETFPKIKQIRFITVDAYWSRATYREISDIIEREKPDLAHIHNTFLVISPSVYQACEDKGVPVVQTLHNYRFLCPIALFYRRGRICEDCLSQGRKAAVFNRCWKDSYFLSLTLKNIVDQFYAKDILTKKIHRFIVLSEFSKRKHVGQGFDESRLVVKPNFLTADPGDQSRKEDYALYVGALQDYKGILLLLNTWKKFNIDLPLKVVGDGPLIEQVKALSQGQRIEYAGRLSSQELIALMQRARFLVIPSQCYENFPRVLVEAYACGLPVVASRLGALIELVSERETGLLFEPNNPEDLAAKVNMLAHDKNLCRQMGLKARETFQRKYTMESNYQALLSIYRQVLETSTRRQLASG